jgi:hypothetical protein
MFVQGGFLYLIVTKHKLTVHIFGLAQISSGKGAGEHVFRCDGSLKGLAIPRI